MNGIPRDLGFSGKPYIAEYIDELGAPPIQPVMDVVSNVRELRSGGFGAVIQGNANDGGGKVCVKFMRDIGCADKITAFLRELTIYSLYLNDLTDLERELVLSLRGLVWDNVKGLGMVTPMIGGNCLGTELRETNVIRHFKWNDVAVAQVALAMAMSLSVLEDRDLINNDVKPENFFLSGRGVLNEGIARMVLGDFDSTAPQSYYAFERQGQSPDLETLFGNNSGNCFESSNRFTPNWSTGSLALAYAPPEVVRTNDSIRSGKAPLYSLGVILSELILGQNVFVSSRSAGNILWNHCNSHVYMNQDYNGSRLRNLILSLLQKSPDDRGLVGSVNLETALDVIKYLLNMDWGKTRLPKSPMFQRAQTFVRVSETVKRSE